MNNPYEVLGVPYGATREEIKQQYHRLAMKHHPDRWAGKNISPAELNVHQETFKNITVAYNLLMESQQPFQCDTDTDGGDTRDSWDILWKRMEEVLSRKHVMEPLSYFLKATFNQIRLRRAATADGHDAPASSSPPPSTEHTFTIPVSLEEIHLGKRKKVRLLLKDDPEPVYVSVMCDRYPKYETTVLRSNGTRLTLSLTLYPKTHPTYSLDYVVDEDLDVDETSGYNLYRAVPMNLVDYFQGKHVEWVHLDGHPQYVWIPPFDPADIGYSNLWKKLPGKGLQSKGDLYITLDWRFPTLHQWESAMNSTEKDAFILFLDKLTHVDDCSGAFSASEK